MPTRSVRLIPLCGSFGGFSAPCSVSGKTSGSSHTRSRTGLASTTRRICGPIRTRICRGIGCRNITLSPKSHPKEAAPAPMKQDMTPEKILAMDTTIKAELNKVFGSDVSSVFFGGLSALALADDGAFVFEKVLEAVAPLVEEAHKAGIAAAEARLKKHTAVYADFSKGLAPGQQA